MATFDPYHKWLGIPPAEQPANHYRLLGLTLFESDPDVIDVATDQRVAYLRQCATGQHIAESQKLLNEIAAARLCLLKAQKKREYDQRLRQSLAAAQVPAQSTASAPVMMPGESPSDERPDAVKAAVVQSPKRGERVARKNSSSAPVAFTGKRIAVASGLLVVVVLGFVLTRGGSDPDKPTSDGQQGASATNDVRRDDENKPKPAANISSTSPKNSAGSTSKSSVAETATAPLADPDAKSKASSQEVSRADADRLQGRWECVFEEASGTENTAIELAALKKVMTVTGNRLTIQRSVNGVAGEYRGTFVLGWNGDRKLFDFTGTAPNGQQVEFLGVYEFDGDVFRLCYRRRPENDPSRERAFEFGTWAGSARVFNKFRPASTPLVSAPPVSTPPANTPPNGFTALFNGKDLTGWKGLVKNIRDRQKMMPRQIADEQKQADARMKAHWNAVNGVLVFDGGGENLVSSKEYGNFELYVDWKIGPLGDSGVYLRGTPQIQICDPDNPKKASKGAAKGSGGLYNNLKTSQFPDVRADNPIGQWNTLFIRMVGDKVTVVLNGKTVVNNVAMENYWERDKPSYPIGPIELQSYGSTLYFKNIYVRELPKK